ncbi:MAG: glycosyltransferase family 2 protein [Arcticibacter sp.]
MSYKPSVAIVILNWNGQALLEKFLPSVVNSTYPNLRIVVADNASADDSVDYVKRNFPFIEVIQNEHNEGFARGYNTILKQVEADYYVLLNSDVEVTQNWIEPVIDLMESDELIAAAQPRIRAYYSPELFEHAGAAGGFIDAYGYPFCRGRIFDTVEKDEGQYTEASEIFWASGAALFIKSRYWKDAQGFDADFFAHMEEIDLCWRLKRRGLKIMYCPDSTVYHVGGGTLETENPYKTYLNFRNNLSMLLKNLDTNRCFYVIFMRFWLDFITLLKFAAAGKFKHAAAISKAHRSFFSDLRRNRAKRAASGMPFNDKGLYKKSIVWQYFVLGKKQFSEL